MRISARLRLALLMCCSVAGVTFSVAAQNLGTVDITSPALTKEQVLSLKKPIPFSPASIRRGKAIYTASQCANCHGPDGKALMDAMGNATDLTSPELYKSGSSEGEIFRSIRDGAGLAMKAWKEEIHNERDIWDLVNYIENWWPADKKPPVQPDPS